MAGDRPSAFFKVLLDGFTEKLWIPIKFSRAVVGEKEWRKARLKSSLGKIWSVKVLKDSNGFHYIGDGWREFVQAHDLRFGYFLVFSYCGCNLFLVTVFDHSECRKWYPSTLLKDGNLMEGKSDVGDCEVSENSEVAETEQPVTNPQKEMVDAVKKCVKVKKKPQLGVSKKPQFKVTINPCNLRRKAYMRIPSPFVRSNDLSGIPRAVLANLNGCWTVSLCHPRWNDQIGAQFGKGWQAFWSKNNLKVGDVCIFELLSKDENGVHFFVSKDQELPSENKLKNAYIIGNTSMEDVIVVKDYEAMKVVGRGKKIEQDDCMTHSNKQKVSRECISVKKGTESFRRPQFYVEIRPHNLLHVKSYLTIPSSFEGSKFLLGKKKATLEDGKGKSWHVSLYQNHLKKNAPHFQIGAGWLSFAHENGLEVGDLCSFKLTSKTDIVLHFEVFKKKEINN